MGGINENELPSNKYKKQILTNSEINELEKICITHNKENECIEKIRSLDTQLYSRYHRIRSQCNKESRDPRCCRDMNYCIDNIISIIKTSKFNDSYKKEYIDIIENYWRGIFDKRHEYECKREKETDSIFKRCILSQLYDYNDDKNYLVTTFGEKGNVFQEYDKYLVDKWSRILKSEKSNAEHINITINRDLTMKKIKCNNLPLTYDFLSTSIINDLQEVNVEFETQNAEMKALVLPTDNAGLSSQTIHSANSIEEGVMQTETVNQTNSSFIRIIVTVISMFLGFCFLSLVLYKFSSLGSLVNERNKKAKKKQKILNYENTQFIEEPEYNQYYIGYDSSYH
ncbi:PIR Superfamily Protein [Plasmodium ovale wallikeri]|uniref:PIR Superfamily Protein n=1 Tax=Plasmodium ovale wallikeri TaxID=864142 RepID=A0A1A9ALP1_PLAOA|nr:PIR Superfamily Protein [Plasmodium ovale wallikeri]SBT59483.1 PIR Superfamily Protein [Plasmodium ovale wallikeri]